MNPYAVLDLPKDCTDADVRVAYQKWTKEYPPEQCPETFIFISEAERILRTPVSRCKWILGKNDETASPEEVLEEFLLYPGRKRPMKFPAFRSMLRDCAVAARKE